MGLKGSLRNVSTGVIAIPDSVIDQFEQYNGGLSLSDNYPNTTASSVFSITTDTVFQGDQALLADATADGTEILFSEFGDGLEDYPNIGDRFQLRFRSDSENPTRSGVCWGDELNGDLPDNGLTFDHNDGDFRVLEGSAGNEITTVSETQPSDEWTIWEFDTDADTNDIEWTVYNQGSGEGYVDEDKGDVIFSTVVDGSAVANLRGWGYRTAEKVYYDDVVIIE